MHLTWYPDSGNNEDEINKIVVAAAAAILCLSFSLYITLVTRASDDEMKRREHGPVFPWCEEMRRRGRGVGSKN